MFFDIRWGYRGLCGLSSFFLVSGRVVRSLESGGGGGGARAGERGGWNGSLGG